MGKHYLVTGGSGFIGSAVVNAMVDAGYKVTVLDDNSRGNPRRLSSCLSKIKMINGDVRKYEDVLRASEGVDGIAHLAYVNGTEFFYTKPDLVLDVGVKGMMNVIDACKHHNIKELVLASSSEVYQTPPVVPTPEDVPLSVPDVMNPRYSYGGGKIISEMMAINYGKYFDRVLIFRPHNVFGEDMGWEHVIPQFALRMSEIKQASPEKLKFPIQGKGTETRSFIYIKDFVDGYMTMLEKGQHLNVYNIGTMEELSIANVATLVGKCFDRDVELVPGPEAKGGTPRRCPEMKKLYSLGFKPKWTLSQALPQVVKWYDENKNLKTETR